MKIHRSKILPTVLYLKENWSHAREERYNWGGGLKNGVEKNNWTNEASNRRLGKPERARLT